MLAVVSYAIYADVRFASHAVLLLIEGSGGIACFGKAFYTIFQFLNLNNKKLVMPPQLLAMAFGLAQTCLGNAGTIWFLLPFFIRRF